MGGAGGSAPAEVAEAAQARLHLRRHDTALGRPDRFLGQESAQLASRLPPLLDPVPQLARIVRQVVELG